MKSGCQGVKKKNHNATRVVSNPVDVIAKQQGKFTWLKS